jgi:hypothetical protein
MQRNEKEHQEVEEEQGQKEEEITNLGFKISDFRFLIITASRCGTGLSSEAMQAYI